MKSLSLLLQSGPLILKTMQWKLSKPHCHQVNIVSLMSFVFFISKLHGDYNFICRPDRLNWWLILG